MGAELEGVDSLLNTTDRIADEWGDRRTVVYIVGTNVEYAPAVEFGSARHVIRGDPLRFEVGGEVVFAQSVDHPGTDPQPFLRPALEAADRNLRTLAEGATSVEDFTRRVALFVEHEAKDRAPVETGNLRSSIRSERVQ
jgi:hypothetical protein